jgi:hypothetical protein
VTPVKMPKFHLKKLTPVLSHRPEHNFVELPSGKFSKFLAISLKTVFNAVCFEEDSEKKALPLVLGQNMSKISELSKFSEILEDVGILHDKITFKQVIELLCSDAKEEQIQVILDWTQSWEEGRFMKTTWRKNKSCSKGLSSNLSEKRRTK